MKARFSGSNDAKVRNPNPPYPLSADQVRLARAMADLLIDAAERTGAPFHQGDLVLKRYLSSSGGNDLLCILGDHDVLSEVIEYARSFGRDETVWAETNDGQART